MKQTLSFAAVMLVALAVQNNAKASVDAGYEALSGMDDAVCRQDDTVVHTVNSVRTFIPDGPDCPDYARYYEAPVVFTEFPDGRCIENGSEIRSVCINMEHSFMGDLSVSLVCPTGQEAVLFFGRNDENRPSGVHHGGGTFLGIPTSDSVWNPSGQECDSLQNPFGVGRDYCFSRNHDYTLVTGDRADAIDGSLNGDWFITGRGDVIQDSDMVIIPSYFTNHNNGQDTTLVSVRTKQPSNYENKTDYYAPYSDFSELIGCPMNGIWKIKVCDHWGVDNGWVFNWSLDLSDDTSSVSISTVDDVANDIAVYAVGTQIHIEKAAGESVEIVGVDGKTIASFANAGNRVVVPVEATGVYVVRVGTRPARKVMVVK